MVSHYHYLSNSQTWLYNFLLKTLLWFLMLESLQGEKPQRKQISGLASDYFSKISSDCSPLISMKPRCCCTKQCSTVFLSILTQSSLTVRRWGFERKIIPIKFHLLDIWQATFLSLSFLKYKLWQHLSHSVKLKWDKACNCPPIS